VPADVEKDIRLFEALRSRFTRQPKWQALVGWQIYYRAFLQDPPGRSLISHRGPWVGEELQQVEVIEAIAAGKKLIAVSGFPGGGKSRFALEIARRIAGAHRTWDVRFVRHDEAAVRAELQELTTLNRLLLIVDDADECPQLIQLLCAACSGADQETPRHLVCLSRPAGRAAVTAALATHFPVGTALEVDLGRPSSKLIRELIDKLIPQVSPHHRDTLRRLVGDWFFATVLLCNGVSRQKSLPQTLSPKHLKDYVLYQPITRVTGDLCTPEKALRALAVYAASSPVRPEDMVIRDSAAGLSGLSLSDVQVLEQRMLLAGLLHKDERGLLRLTPDLSGALILDETCIDGQGRPTAFGKAIIRQLFAHDPDALIRNCAGIARLFATPADVDLVSPVVLEQAAMMQPQTRSATLGLLKSSRALAQRKPAVIFSLFQLLEAHGAVRREFPAGELDHLDGVELHAQDLLLSASGQLVSGVRLAMEYSRDLLVASHAFSESSAVLRDALVRYCRFSIGLPVTHAESVLDVLQDWAAHQNDEYAELAASLLRGYLELETHALQCEDGAPIPPPAGFALTNEIARVRDRAISTLVRCAHREEPGVQFEAAQALQNWLQGYEKLNAELRERWAPQLEKESQVLADSFSKTGSSTPYLPVRAAIEKQGWRLWIHPQEGYAQRLGGRLLRSLAAEAPYALWKALHDGTLPITTVGPDEKMPANERLGHFLALTDLKPGHVEQLAKRLFDELDPLCVGTVAWLDIFALVLRSLPERNLQPHVDLYLAEFVVRHPVESWSLVTKALMEAPLRPILPSLLAQLRRHDNARWQEMIQQARAQTHLFDVILRALWVSSELSPIELEVVAQGLDLEDSTAVHKSAQTLLNVSSTATIPSLRAVLSVLRTSPADERLWELAIDAFVRWGNPVVMLAVPDEDRSAEVRAISGEFLQLLRTSGDAVDWSQGPHTRALAPALAVIAVAVPHTLKAWMREVWYQLDDSSRNDSPLSISRFSELARLIAESPAKFFWQKQFLEWMSDEAPLSLMGARGLVELCGRLPPADLPTSVREALARATPPPQ
jgi:hypothetical protein